MASNRRKRQRGERVFLTVALIVVAAFAAPVIGLAVRAPWDEIGAHLRSSEVLDALRLSAVVSLGALALCVIAGFPVAWVLARIEFPGRTVVRAAVAMPMVMPPVVAGVGLLSAFGRRGLFGPALETIGVRLPFTTAAAMVAAAFVAAPFFILTIEAALAGSDRRLEQAAATMGASGWTVLRTVTLPGIRPSIVAGAALSWARALGEFGATITFAGNLEGTTQTLPLAVYQQSQTDPDRAVLTGLLLVLISLIVLVSLRGKIRLP